MSSQRYQEFIAERTRLLERIRELETENAELKKRLGEPVTPMPPASSAMQNLSLQEKIDLFCSLFKGRDDVFARRWYSKTSGKAGEQRRVEFLINSEQLKYYNHDLQYVLEPGDFDIMLGPNSRDVKTVVLNVKQLYKLML
ncbi:MAG: fibronectin type III-like domain-contianing protein [Bacteroidaceae bacterium]|nr:fibronectin type III-like domain-contianing protein [Bacteroidaceae bacterium]